MKKLIYNALSDNNSNMRYKIIGLYLIIGIFTLFSWSWAYHALHSSPLLFDTAILAYIFGLRHAVDADHIAAIDNVTRKLMQEGKKPVSVGFFFSLGHSSVVIIATIIVALTTSKLMTIYEDSWRDTAKIVCTLISSSFLVIISAANILILISLYKTFRIVRNGGIYYENDINDLLDNRGFFARIFRTFFKMVTKSWHMYFIGFLFAIGFDTATEIAILGIAAAQTIDGVSLSTMLIFPTLFAAGIALVDATDCVLMVGAYGWAFLNPVRKLYYNMTITFVSIAVALVIGGIEALGLIGDHFHLETDIWLFVKKLNDNFNSLGYFIIGIFIISWIISVLLYKYLQISKIENNIISTVSVQTENANEIE